MSHVSTELLVLFGTICFGIGLWMASFAIEALRRAPLSPRRLGWTPDIAIKYVCVDGCRLRYICAGQGPKLILLHTLRTQLDLFEKIVPDLSKTHTVYALDYPGHGYSDIPKAKYDAEFFVRSVEGFLAVLDLHDVTLCGVSIGASISLIIASRGNARVARVVAVNSYDYARGRGFARSSPFARMIMATSRLPVIGETVMRLRTFWMFRAIVAGGLANPRNISSALLSEMLYVGNRRRHYRAFLSLLRNTASWERATVNYRRTAVPVLLVWGEKDWTRAKERARDGLLVPGAESVTVKSAGHFLPLDRPDALIEQIRVSAARGVASS